MNIIKYSLWHTCKDHLYYKLLKVRSVCYGIKIEINICTCIYALNIMNYFVVNNQSLPERNTGWEMVAWGQDRQPSPSTPPPHSQVSRPRDLTSFILIKLSFYDMFIIQLFIPCTTFIYWKQTFRRKSYPLYRYLVKGCSLIVHFSSASRSAGRRS